MALLRRALLPRATSRGSPRNRRFRGVFRSPALPIYLAAGSIFAALAARNFLTPLRVHELGGSKLQVGLLFSVFTVTAAGLSLPAGLLADRFGRRSLVVFAVLTGGISQVGLAAASSVAPMFLWQALAGLGGGASQAALFAALADATPGYRLGRAVGWLTLSMQVGFLSGPAGAGLALQWLSLQATLAAVTALFGVALVMALFVSSRTAPTGRHGWGLREPLREIAGQRGFAPAVLGMLAATLLWGTLQAYLPLFGKEQLRLPEARIGYMIALQAVANGLARIPGGRLVDRYHRRNLIVIVGLIGFAAALALLPHLTGFWAASALLVLSVPLVATVYIALSVAFTSLATEETRGVAMGLYSVVLFAGLGAGPAIFGPVMDRSGYVAGFTACAVTGLVLVGLVAVLRSQRLRQRSLAAWRGEKGGGVRQAPEPSSPPRAR